LPKNKNLTKKDHSLAKKSLAKKRLLPKKSFTKIFFGQEIKV